MVPRTEPHARQESYPLYDLFGLLLFCFVFPLPISKFYFKVFIFKISNQYLCFIKKIFSHKRTLQDFVQIVVNFSVQIFNYAGQRGISSMVRRPRAPSSNPQPKGQAVQWMLAAGMQSCSGLGLPELQPAGLRGLPSSTQWYSRKHVVPGIGT